MKMYMAEKVTSKEAHSTTKTDAVKSKFHVDLSLEAI
jgi:hypothetical protein